MNHTLEHICQKAMFETDIDGNVFEYDHDHYRYLSAFDMYNIFFQAKYFNESNFSDNTASFTGNETEWLNDGSDLNSKSDYIVRVQEFLSNLDPSRDPDLKSQIMVRNLLTLAAYSIIILVSLFGNFLVMFIILSRTRLRVQTTNKLIANLTLSDCMLTILTIPLTVVRLLFDSWPLGSVLCQLGPMVQALSVYVSTISMVVISIERHQVLLGSLPKRLSPTLSSVWTIVFIWVLAAIFSTPHFIFNRVVYRQTYTCVKRCEALYPNPARTYSRAITVFTVTTQYLGPLLITAICYYHIGMHIWKRVRIGAMTRSQKYSHLQARKRTIKMLILVVFTICHWFGVSSACVNPFIYFWLNKQYKQRARRIIQICFKCDFWRCCPGRSEFECDPNETCSSFENGPGRSFRNKQTLVLKDISHMRSHIPKRSSCLSDITENGFEPPRGLRQAHT